jgi:hypothetical protein
MFTKSEVLTKDEYKMFCINILWNLGHEFKNSNVVLGTPELVNGFFRHVDIKIENTSEVADRLFEVLSGEIFLDAYAGTVEKTDVGYTFPAKCGLPGAGFPVNIILEKF